MRLISTHSRIINLDKKPSCH